MTLILGFFAGFFGVIIVSAIIIGNDRRQRKNMRRINKMVDRYIMR